MPRPKQPPSPELVKLTKKQETARGKLTAAQQNVKEARANHQKLKTAASQKRLDAALDAVRQLREQVAEIKSEMATVRLKDRVQRIRQQIEKEESELADRLADMEARTHQKRAEALVKARERFEKQWLKEREASDDRKIRVEGLRQRTRTKNRVDKLTAQISSLMREVRNPESSEQPVLTQMLEKKRNSPGRGRPPIQGGVPTRAIPSRHRNRTKAQVEGEDS